MDRLKDRWTNQQTDRQTDVQQTAELWAADKCTNEWIDMDGRMNQLIDGWAEMQRDRRTERLRNRRMGEQTAG